MDHRELYSEIRECHSKIFKLDSDVSDRIFKIWLVMLLGFELFAIFGLCLIHRAYIDSVDEMHREIAALQSKASPQAARLHASGVR